jgi:hypothetical protein
MDANKKCVVIEAGHVTDPGGFGQRHFTTNNFSGNLSALNEAEVDSQLYDL